MKIVVIGGSGLIGSKLVKILRERGNEVVPASPATGVDTITGKGLDDALKGAQVVVDVSNSPSFEDAAVMKFFETSTRNLLAAEKKAGVKHHVALSIVGADRNPDSGYLRAKVAQEKLIKDSGIPYTILRATQFFEFTGGIADGSTEGNTVRLTSAKLQPIAADDVAAALAPDRFGGTGQWHPRGGRARANSSLGNCATLAYRKTRQTKSRRRPQGSLLWRRVER